jgi:hypothetical protein
MMKFTKMSLVAALLVGSSAFAIENTKISGDANIVYQTDNIGNDNDWFSKNSSAADIGLNLNVTTDLAKNDMVSISAGAGYTVLTTLGLENNLVSKVWGGAHGVTAESPAVAGFPAKVEDASWMNEAWVAATTGKTTAKLGRMELDTPLAFTEKWSIEKNTFEAAVLINQNIPDTTLVAAWVGNGNGGNDTLGATGAGDIVNSNGKFNTFARGGAYAVAAINNSFKPLMVQGWYYNVLDAADAIWLQADLACEKIPGLMAGVQYASLAVKGSVEASGAKDTDALALMLGYEVKDIATVKVAYSQTGKDKGIDVSNVATGHTVGSQSKLYTEAWWNYGKISQADTTAFNLTITAPVADVADFGLFYTMADQADKVNGAAANNDLAELTLSASRSFGPLDASLVYIYADVEDNKPATDDKSHTLQAYIKVNF